MKRGWWLRLRESCEILKLNFEAVWAYRRVLGRGNLNSEQWLFAASRLEKLLGDI